MLALTDVLATLAAIVEYPLSEKDGIDSYNLLSALKGEKSSGREEVIVQSSGKLFAIVQGKWKYIGVGNYKKPNPEDPPGELYDLSMDESEQYNLYNDHPEIARRLHDRLLQFVEQDAF